jgi:hypothetical protein
LPKKLLLVLDCRRFSDADPLQSQHICSQSEVGRLRHLSEFDHYASSAEKAQREADETTRRESLQGGGKTFSATPFAVAVPLGLIALVVGAFLSLPAIGTRLMVGGLFSVCDGYFNYWSQLADVLKFGFSWSRSYCFFSSVIAGWSGRKSPYETQRCLDLRDAGIVSGVHRTRAIS